MYILTSSGTENDLFLPSSVFTVMSNIVYLTLFHTENIKHTEINNYLLSSLVYTSYQYKANFYNKFNDKTIRMVPNQRKYELSKQFFVNKVVKLRNMLPDKVISVGSQQF